MEERTSILVVESSDCLSEVIGIITSKCLDLIIDARTDIYQALRFLHRLRHDIPLCDLPISGQERPNFINDIFDTEKAPIAIFTTTDTSFTRDMLPPSLRERVPAVLHKPLDINEMFIALDAALSASSKSATLGVKPR